MTRLVDEGAPPSQLKAFDPVPKRAKQDNRLTAKDHRFLNAVCSAVDPATGYAHIGQRALAKRSAIPRRKIYEYPERLQAVGYIKIIDRGRHRSGAKAGQRKTNLYRVLYDEADYYTDGDQSLAPESGAKVEPQSLAPESGAEGRHPNRGPILEKREKKKGQAPLIFPALTAADCFDDHVEVAQQTELPLPEVQRFADLYQRAEALHGKGKVLKLDMAMRKAHPSDQRGYLKALTLKLEELTSEQPTELVDLAAARRRRR